MRASGVRARWLPNDILGRRQIGTMLFKQLFRSVTAYNGGEFCDFELLESSAVSAKQRLTLNLLTLTVVSSEVHMRNKTGSSKNSSPWVLISVNI